MATLNTKLKEPFNREKWEIAKEFFLNPEVFHYGIPEKELPYFVKRIKTNYPPKKS